MQAREGRSIVHVCNSECAHGGPFYIKWPWKNVGAVIETWNTDPAKAMPVGMAVSMGAYAELLR